MDIDRPDYIHQDFKQQQKGTAAKVPFRMQLAIMADVKKLASPRFSTVIFRKSSRRIGQIALVGC
jgi:hypothetical protein